MSVELLQVVEFRGLFIDVNDRFGPFGRVIVGRKDHHVSSLFDPINRKYHTFRTFPSKEAALDNIVSEYYDATYDIEGNGP